MKLIIVLVLLGLVGLLAVQNLEPIQLIFFGGSLVLKLPIVIWIILFTLAGLFTSLFLQILVTSFRSPSPAQPRAATPPPLKPEPPKPSYTVKDPLFDDWEEQPSPRPAIPQEDREPQEFPKRKGEPQSAPDEDIPSFEVQRPPQTASHSGTIYSYTYREEEPKPPEKKEQPVYDANYRVITPPYKGSDNPPEAEDDSEEWI